MREGFLQFCLDDPSLHCGVWEQSCSSFEAELSLSDFARCYAPFLSCGTGGQTWQLGHWTISRIY